MTSLERTGRNDPCPCGSGKKFKRCCRAQAEVQRAQDLGGESLWYRLRQTEDRIIRAVMEWASPRLGPNGLFDAWHDFVFAAEEGESPVDDLEFEGLFIPWWIFSWRAHAGEPGAAGSGDASEPLAMTYLKERAARLDPFERRFIETLCARPFSFHQVRAAEPGESLILRDLLSGEEWTVSERTASRTLVRGMIVYTRVLPFDDVAICLGCGATPFPGGHATRILDLRKAITDRDEPLPAQLVRELDDPLRMIYLEIAEELRNPPEIQLRNTDGDPFEQIRLRYELLASPAAAFELLHSLALFHSREELLEDAELDAEGRISKVAFEWLKRGNKQHKSWDNTILGRIEIAPGELTIEVNSRRRAGRIRKEIDRRLGEDARLLEENVRTPASLMAEARNPSPELTAQRRHSREESEALEREPEARAFMERMWREHWANWLDEELPALRGKTPRQAARDPRGREWLEALLLSFESSAADATGPNLLAPDVAALRRELGLGAEASPRPRRSKRIDRDA